MPIGLMPNLSLNTLMRMPTHVSGKRYTRQLYATTASGALTQDLLRLGPMWIPNSGYYDRIGADHTVAAASSVYRLGIYTDSGSFSPSTLVLDAGTIDTSVAAAYQEITINQYLEAGLYWVGGVSQGGNPTMTNQTTMLQWFTWHTTSQGTTTVYSLSGVTGALPATFTGTGTGGSGPARVLLRRA